VLSIYFLFSVSFPSIPYGFSINGKTDTGKFRHDSSLPLSFTLNNEYLVSCYITTLSVTRFYTVECRIINERRFGKFFKEDVA
jgi:hypothetical protein